MSAQPEFPEDPQASPPEPLDFGAEFAKPFNPFASEQDVIDQAAWQQEADPSAGTAAGFGRADANGRAPRHPSDPVRLLAWPWETPGAAAIMVEQLLDTGGTFNWNTFPLEATHEMVLDRTGAPGTYQVTPIDEFGTPLVERQQLHRFTIPANHPFLLQRRGPGGPAAYGPGYGSPLPGFGAPPGANPDPYLRHMETAESRLQGERMAMFNQTARREAELRAGEQELYRRMLESAELTAARTALQVDTAVQRTTALSDQAHKTTVGMLTSGFEGLSKIQADALASERIRAEHALAADRLRLEVEAREARADRERRDTLERQERERRDALDRAEKEDRRRREEEEKIERRAREERDRVAAREHQLELEKLRAAQNPMNMIAAVVGLLPTVAAGFKAMGIEPGEIISNALGVGGAKGVTETVGDVITEGLRTLGKIARPDANWDEVEEEIDATTGQVLSSRVIRRAPPMREPAQIPQAPQEVPQAPPPTPVPTGTPAGFAAPPPVASAPAGPQGFATPGFAAPPPGGPMPVPTAPGLDAAGKSRARRAIFALVEKLTASPQESWPIITHASMSDPASAGDVGAYLRAYTIRAAAEEAGGKPELVQAFIDMLDALGVAKDIPRG